MNKNIKNALDKMVALDTCLTSAEGYAIYDLMQEIKVDNGNGQKLDRWGASGIVFYTEDNKTLEQLSVLRTQGNLEAIKDFLIEYKDFLRPLHSYEHEKIEEMNHSASFAFSHLSTPEQRKRTLKQGNYGIAHLVEDQQILIFHQNKGAISDLFKTDLNKSENYIVAQKGLRKAYEEGKVQPEGIIKGNAYNIVLESLLDINIKKMSDYQQDTILILKQFTETLHDNKVSFAAISKKNIHTALFKYGNDKIEITIPENKKDGLALVVNDGIEEDSKYKMTLPQALYFINKEIAANNTNQFIKKLKL